MGEGSQPLPLVSCPPSPWVPQAHFGEMKAARLEHLVKLEDQRLESSRNRDQPR